MSGRFDLLTPTVARALERAEEEQAKVAWLWELTPAQRLAAFYRGDMNLGACLAWARRHPKEPPLAADGEYLFIAWKTPEWADATDVRQPTRPAPGRER